MIIKTGKLLSKNDFDLITQVKIKIVFEFEHICLINILKLQPFCDVINLRNTELLNAFGKHLRMLRQKNNLTLEQLAFEADIEVSQVYRIEKGKNNPTLSTLNALSNALKISLPKLLDF